MLLTADILLQFEQKNTVNFANMTKVLTAGVFDLIHRGHVELFRRAKEQGDYLTVLVHADEFIRKPGVIQSTEERVFMCKAIRYVDDALPYGNLDEDVPKMDFDVYVCGEDQLAFPHVQSIRRWCEEHSKLFVVLPRTPELSSASLRHQIAEMDH